MNTRNVELETAKDFFFLNQKHSEGDPHCKVFLLKNKLKGKLQGETYREELGCKAERKKGAEMSYVQRLSADLPCNPIDVESKKKGACAKAGRRQRGLASSMATPDNNDVIPLRIQSASRT